jgi:hypothetical protein
MIFPQSANDTADRFVDAYAAFPSSMIDQRGSPSRSADFESRNRQRTDRSSRQPALWRSICNIPAQQDDILENVMQQAGASASTDAEPLGNTIPA